MKATPNANSAVPIKRPPTVWIAATTDSPAADAASAEPASVAAPMRSGSRAPTIRRPTTIRPYSASGRLAPSRPIVRT